MDTGNSGLAGHLVMLDVVRGGEGGEDFVMNQGMEDRNVKVVTENQKCATLVNVEVRTNNSC